MEPYKVTKSGLKAILAITVVSVAAVFYLLYKTNASLLNEWLVPLILTVVVIGIILLAVSSKYFTEIRREKYEQSKKIKFIKGIQLFGALSLLYGVMLFGYHNIFDKMIGVSLFVAGYGLMQVKKWGRHIFIVIGTIIVLVRLLSIGNTLKYVIQIISTIKGNSNNLLLALWSTLDFLILLIFVIGIYFFTRSNVREQFK